MSGIWIIISCVFHVGKKLLWSNLTVFTSVEICPVNLATWTVGTLLDRVELNRTQRRSALIASELGRDSVDIAALSETRPPGPVCTTR